MRQGFVGRETWGWTHYSFLVAFVERFIGASIIFINDGIAEAAVFFAFPDYVMGMIEVL